MCCQNSFQGFLERYQQTAGVCELTKFEGPYAGIRELLKHVDHIRLIEHYRQTSILKVVLAGRVVITDEIIEAMKESGYIIKIFYNSVDPELIDSTGDFQSEIQNEDDVPYYMCTNLLLKDTEPPLENGGKSDIQALIAEPIHAEFEAATRDAACNNCNVMTEG
jgi:hypothetical protein